MKEPKPKTVTKCTPALVLALMQEMALKCDRCNRNSICISPMREHCAKEILIEQKIIE